MQRRLKSVITVAEGRLLTHFYNLCSACFVPLKLQIKVPESRMRKGEIKFVLIPKANAGQLVRISPDFVGGAFQDAGLIYRRPDNFIHTTST